MVQFGTLVPEKPGLILNRCFVRNDQKLIDSVHGKTYDKYALRFANMIRDTKHKMISN